MEGLKLKDLNLSLEGSRYIIEFLASIVACSQRV